MYNTTYRGSSLNSRPVPAARSFFRDESNPLNTERFHAVDRDGCRRVERLQRHSSPLRQPGGDGVAQGLQVYHFAPSGDWAGQAPHQRTAIAYGGSPANHRTAIQPKKSAVRRVQGLGTDLSADDEIN